MNPNLLKIKFNPKKMERKHKYGEIIKADYDKLHEIAKEYVSWSSDIPNWRFENLEKIFNFGRRIAKEYSVNLQEIERLFNQVLFKYAGGGLFGSFISGLYSNIIRDDVLELNLKKYPGSVSGLGYKHSRGKLDVIGDKAYYLGVEMNGGKILVRGNVGNYLGKGMKGGKIVVEGNARNWVGENMKGGFILIKGNAGDVIGEKMSGGEIMVEGDAGYWVGDDMKGGIIRIRGEYKSLSGDRRGGEIYQWMDGDWIRIG